MKLNFEFCWKCEQFAEAAAAKRGLPIFFPKKGFLHEIEGENEAPGIESKGPPAQVRQGEAAETKVETRAQW